MFASRVQDEVEMQRRPNNRIFPDERQNQPKALYQTARADRFGANRTDVKNPEKLKVLNEGNKPWHQHILDPGSNIVLRWNRVYLVACLFALFIDPFFYYLPLIIQNDNGSSCVDKDQGLSIRITVLRSLADLFYMLNIAIKFHTAYVAPNLESLERESLLWILRRFNKDIIKN